MTLTIILLICIIILAVIVALEFHAIRVLLEDREDTLQMIDEAEENVLEVYKEVSEVLQHTEEMIALSQQINEDNERIIKMLRETEKRNGKA